MARPTNEDTLAIHAFLCTLPAHTGACAAYIARELQISRDRTHDALDRLVATAQVVVLPQKLKVPGVNKPLNLYAPAEVAGDPSMFDALRHGIVRVATEAESE